MQRDKNGLVYLDRAACLELVGSRSFGRVGVTVGALPTVLPVNYRLKNETIYFRSGAGQKLAAATARHVVAFEVDEADAYGHAGWSVVVTGIAEVVEDPMEVLQLEQFGVPSWVVGGNAKLIALATDVVSGRRLDPVERLNVS